MNARTVRIPEDGVPMLTETVRLPGSAGPHPSAEPDALPTDAERLAGQLQREVLARLRAPEFGLEAELMEHLRPMVERASRRFAAELTAQLQATLSYVTETVVERAVGEVLAERAFTSDAPPPEPPVSGPPAQG